MRLARMLTAAAIALASGFAALQYEVLWARQLRELVGGSVAAGTWTVAWFFVGLSFGAWRLGPGADRSPNPWRRLAGLEIGIVVVVLPMLGLDRIAEFALPHVGHWMWGPAGGGVKAALVGLVVLPPAFLMGGTLPALGAAAITEPLRAGSRRAWLYGLNTLGGAAGIAFVSFLSLPRFGALQSFLVALGVGLLVALAAWVCSLRHRSRHAEVRLDSTDEPTDLALATQTDALLLAALSGFGVLAAEVLVFIAFAQVFASATFSFAAMLLVVVLMLGVAALIVPLLATMARDIRALLMVALPAAGLITAAFPWLFLLLTDGLQQAGDYAGRVAYIRYLFKIALLSAGGVFAAAGVILPAVFALDASATFGSRSWSRLLAANAAGAMFGAWSAGGWLLPGVGLWGAFVVIGLLYAAAGFALAMLKPARRGLAALCAVLLCAVSASGVMIAYRNPPVLDLTEGEAIVEILQGHEGVAALVDEGAPTLRLNNYYWLGGADRSAVQHQRRMGLLPLLLHPSPRRVAHVGLGMGITAGTPLVDPEVESLIALELSPLVVRLARKHLRSYGSGVFTDHRAQIIVEDGRTFLRSQRDRFDIVTGDLFTPWRRGVGAAYTVEQFRAARNALRPGGVFCQWLPVYQLDVPTLDVILASFVRVFPDGVLMHASLDPDGPTLALVGFRDRSYPYGVIRRRCERARTLGWTRDPLLRHGMGVAMLMIGPAGPLVDPATPVNTLDNGWVEFHAPVAHVQDDGVFIYDTLFDATVGFLQSDPRSFAELRHTMLRGAPTEAMHAMRAGAKLYDLRVAWLDDSVDDRLLAAMEEDLLRSLPTEIVQDEYWTGP